MTTSCQHLPESPLHGTGISKDNLVHVYRSMLTIFPVEGRLTIISVINCTKDKTIGQFLTFHDGYVLTVEHTLTKIKKK